MAMSQLDSFFFKFKQLLHSGRNAQLEVKSEAGKATIKLTTEVEVPVPPKPSRNGPSRQRRRERRAAARADAEQVVPAEEVVAAERVVAAQQEDVLEVEETMETTAEQLPGANNFKDAVEATDLDAVKAIEPKDEIVNEKMSDEKSEQFAYSVSVIPVQRIYASDSSIEKVVF